MPLINHLSYSVFIRAVSNTVTSDRYVVVGLSKQYYQNVFGFVAGNISLFRWFSMI